MSPRRRESADDVRARLDAGNALSPGQVARLLGMTRFAVDYWLNRGLRVRGEAERWFPPYTETPGGQRMLRPDVVRRILAMRQAEHQGPRSRDESEEA